jgi:hypothetical protein
VPSANVNTSVLFYAARLKIRIAIKAHSATFFPKKKGFTIFLRLMQIPAMFRDIVTQANNPFPPTQYGDTVEIESFASGQMFLPQIFHGAYGNFLFLFIPGQAESQR